MTNRALLHVHSIANLFHLGLAVFILHSTALLLIRGTALVLVGRHSLVLGATVILHLLRHIPSIHGEGHEQNSGKAGKQISGVTVHLF